MKDCNDCSRASWERTKTGRLHPSGAGHCDFILDIIILPSAYYFVSETPNAYGGHIERGKPHRQCPKWEAKELLK